MERKKEQQQAYIQDDNARRTTYKKRVKSIVKKTEELSTLCGVDACAIIYGPDDKVPVVWPSTEDGARRIITAFKSKSEAYQSERQLNQDTYLQQSVNKATEKLMRLKRINREMEMENLITNIIAGKTTLEQVPPTNLGDLLWVLDDKLRAIQHKITVKKRENMNSNSTLAISASASEGDNLNVMSTNQGAN